jgi:hypothetical protein
MARSKGLQSDPIFKLGKSPAQRDARNLKFAAILRAPLPTPKEYDFDATHRGIPTPMFGNDTIGDCVIAGRAHQTLRFEDVEQKKVISITDKNVFNEYYAETGGSDSGLVVLTSIKRWRKKGWIAARRRYFIEAFTEIAPRTPDAIRQAVFLDVGVGLGLNLPLSAGDQIRAGKPWEVGKGTRGKAGSWGGHYVYVPGYTAFGPVCVTWGQKQQMSWAFLKKYCDEAYAVIDAINTAKKKRALDSKKITAFLAALN